MVVLIEIPAIGVLLVASLALLLAYGFEGTFGAAIRWAVGELDKARVSIPIVGSFNPLSPLISILNAFGDAIHAAVGVLETANDWGWNKLVAFNGYAWQELSGAVGDLAEATDQTLGWLWRHKIPLLVGTLLIPVHGLLGWIVPAVRQAYRDIANLAHHPELVIPKTITRIEHLSTTVTRTVYRDVPVAVHTAIAVPIPRIGALERDVTGLEKWVRANIKKVSIAGAVGLVAGAVFSGLKLGWLRCSNVNRVGKFLCGFDRALLDALLAGLAVWLGTLNLRAFAEDVQDVTGTIEGVVRHFWQADIQHITAGHTFGTTGT